MNTALHHDSHAMISQCKKPQYKDNLSASTAQMVTQHCILTVMVTLIETSLIQGSVFGGQNSHYKGESLYLQNLG